MIETSLSSWFCVKAKFFQWAKKPLPTTRKRNLRRIFFFPTFFSFKMLAPGKPEQVEIFPRERLSDQIGHGCLQPLNHFNLNLGEVWGENWQMNFNKLTLVIFFKRLLIQWPGHIKKSAILFVKNSKKIAISYIKMLSFF